MAGSAEIAQVLGGEPILLAQCVLPRERFDALVAQAEINADSGADVVSILSRNEHGGIFFEAADVRPAPDSNQLPQVVGRLGLVNVLAPERDEPQSLAGISRRPAVVTASAIGGLRRALRRKGDEVKLSFWGSAEDPGTYDERRLHWGAHDRSLAS